MWKCTRTHTQMVVQMLLLLKNTPNIMPVNDPVLYNEFRWIKLKYFFAHSENKEQFKFYSVIWFETDGEHALNFVSFVDILLPNVTLFLSSFHNKYSFRWPFLFLLLLFNKVPEHLRKIANVWKHSKIFAKSQLVAISHVFADFCMFYGKNM